MAAEFQFTDPCTHPRFVREQRQITALLVRILIENGWPEPQALSEAEALLGPQRVRPGNSRFRAHRERTA